MRDLFFNILSASDVDTLYGLHLLETIIYINDPMLTILTSVEMLKKHNMLSEIHAFVGL